MYSHCFDNCGYRNHDRQLAAHHPTLPEHWQAGRGAWWGWWHRGQRRQGRRTGGKREAVRGARWVIGDWCELGPSDCQNMTPENVLEAYVFTINQTQDLEALRQQQWQLMGRHRQALQAALSQSHASISEAIHGLRSWLRNTGKGTRVYRCKCGSKLERMVEHPFRTNHRT